MDAANSAKVILPAATACNAFISLVTALIRCNIPSITIVHFLPPKIAATMPTSLTHSGKDIKASQALFISSIIFWPIGVMASISPAPKTATFINSFFIFSAHSVSLPVSDNSSIFAFIDETADKIKSNIPVFKTVLPMVSVN